MAGSIISLRLMHDAAAALAALNHRTRALVRSAALAGLLAGCVGPGPVVDGGATAQRTGSAVVPPQGATSGVSGPTGATGSAGAASPALAPAATSPAVGAPGGTPPVQITRPAATPVRPGAVPASAAAAGPDPAPGQPAGSAGAGVAGTGLVHNPYTRSDQPRLQYSGMPGPGGLLNLDVSEPLRPRTLDLTARTDDVWDRIRNGFAIPNLISPLVVERQAWFLARPEYFVRTLERSGMYRFHIVEELEKRGMPTELALLPFIESAYNPMALSTSRASGIWQFIPSTGKQYNLRQDWWRDERRDILASTEAALTYLQTIYEMQGDWHLALASYNWGENAVKRAMDKNRAQGMPTDYLSLAMPDETRYYVPKLQAVKNIIAHPELFGITLPRIVNQPYFATVQNRRDLDIRTAAKLAGMPVAEFRALNPSFNRQVMTGPTTLLLPADKTAAFESNLASHPESAINWRPYTLSRGDRLDKVAKRFGMSVADLREVNGLGPTVNVKPGQTVLVRAGGADVRQAGGKAVTRQAAAPAAKGARVAGTAKPGKAAPAQAAANHVVRKGETLGSIAQKYGVSVDRLKSANGLKNSNLATGQKLKLPH